MLPLKCFNCGKIAHFSTKYPYAKNSNSDEEEFSKKEKKYQKGNKKENKRKVFKKSFYSKEDKSSSYEEDDSDSDSERVLFMAMETLKGTHENDEEYHEECEVDIEEELISALSEIKRERRKSKSSKEELIKLKESSQNPKEVDHLKTKV